MTGNSRCSVYQSIRRSRLCLRLVVVVCFLFPSAPLLAQEPSPERDGHWSVLEQLAGRWEGAIDGRLGTGAGVREYEFVLEKNFLMWRHGSVRLPQEKSPKGDYHREIGFFSFDPERRKLVARTFIVEKFVNQYVCEVEESRVTCVLEETEGRGGNEWQSRLTLEIRDPYRFDETFELAAPGEELAVYFTNTWTRAPAAP